MVGCGLVLSALSSGFASEGPSARDLLITQNLHHCLKGVWVSSWRLRSLSEGCLGTGTSHSFSKALYCS